MPAPPLFARPGTGPRSPNAYLCCPCEPPPPVAGCCGFDNLQIEFGDGALGVVVASSLSPRESFQQGLDCENFSPFCMPIDASCGCWNTVGSLFICPFNTGDWALEAMLFCPGTGSRLCDARLCVIVSGAGEPPPVVNAILTPTHIKQDATNAKLWFGGMVIDPGVCEIEEFRIDLEDGAPIPGPADPADAC